MNAIKQKILEQAQRDGVQVTALREQVLDIVLKQSGVIKAYNVSVADAAAKRGRGCAADGLPRP